MIQMSSNGVGARLRAVRIAQKLNQRDFADRLGTSSGRISEIESEKTMPGGDFLLRLRQEFDTDITWLLTGQNALPGGSAEDLYMVREAAIREPDGKGPHHDLMWVAFENKGQMSARRMKRLDAIVQRLGTCADEDFDLIEGLLARLFNDAGPTLRNRSK